MSNRQTCEATRSAISSPESAGGRSPCASRAGPMTAPSGQAVAPASPSPSPANGAADETPATCGPFGAASSRSVTLQLSLESRLQALLDVNGSLEYGLRWKRWGVPWGPPICALRASGRHRFGKDCSGWPTPKARDTHGASTPEHLAKKRAAGHGCSELVDAALLAGWPTVTTRDTVSDGPKTEQEYLDAIAEGRPVRQSAQRLRNTALLAGWTTPSATDGERAGTITEKMTGSSLTQQTTLAGWASPAARDYRTPNSKALADRGGGKKGEQLPNQVAHAGPIPESSSAATGKPAAYRLNPRFSLWLMGFPEEMTSCAARAMRSYRKSRRRSSRPPLRQ